MAKRGHYGSKGPKNRIPTHARAAARARELMISAGVDFEAYLCRQCGLWHVGSREVPRKLRVEDVALEQGERVAGCLKAENYGEGRVRLAKIRERTMSARIKAMLRDRESTTCSSTGGAAASHAVR